MNERGFASMTAMIILLMLAYLIRGTNFTAGNYVDMTRNFETENRLRLAAESALERKVAMFRCGTEITVEEQAAALESESTVLDDINCIVRVDVKDRRLYPRSSGSKLKSTVFILAIAQKKNYFMGNMSAYRSVGCLLWETEVQDDSPSASSGVKGYTYEFKGYLHKNL